MIDSLLAEVGTEPGSLALLEHALGQLWEKYSGSDRTLTSVAYSDIGRLRGALAKHAEEVYRGISGEAQQHLAKKIFLELVQLGEGAQDTRRRVAKEVLLRLGRPEQIEQLLARLATSRLISTGQEPHSTRENFVEVSHEALIREWPTLREWLTENRDDIRLERRLLDAAEEWRESHRDPSSLLQGVRLAQAEDWFVKRPDAPALLREFLEASRDAHEEAARREREAQEREFAREQELRQEAEARAEAETHLRQEAERRTLSEEAAVAQARRSAGRIRRFSYALGGLLLLAGGAAWFALQAKTLALSRQLAAEASLLVEREPYLINRAALLAVESVRKGASLPGDEALRGVLTLLPRVIACNDPRSLPSILSR